MRDDLTPKQRLKAISEGRSVDRVPHEFSIGHLALRLTGVDPADYEKNVKTRINAEISLYREYGIDKLSVFYGIPALYGTKSVVPEGGHPYIAETVEIEGDDLKRVYVDDPKTDPRFRDFWDYLDGLIEAVGDEVPITVAFEGTITTAARIIGTEKLLKRTITDPEYVFALLDSVLQTQTAIVESLKGYGVGFWTPDPISSGSVISTKTYRKFSKPYTIKLFGVMTRVSGEKPMLHVCGNTSAILKDITEVGASSFSLDNIMDLEQVKNEIGDKIMLVGNVKPAETMFLGTPQDVDADLKQCFKKAWDTKAGYRPCFGCGLPMGTPKENLDALFNSLQKYGKWPLDPANFA